MNHTCLGDAFEVDGKTYWRCFADSTIVPMPVDGDVCPHCTRPLGEYGEVVPARLRTVQQVEISSVPGQWFPWE